MPHINRIRVNNVKYNFGTQSYEDFMLKPFGHNMLYDLANGGGKSVLMLLMLQTVLPNCSLDDKQPVEKLFRTGDGSQTIHSLIEWKLDEADVLHGFRYMTTGFCARKASNAEEGSRETASIEYFNYCIFYRDYNANDIRNLPLVKDKEKITYTGLRRYLKELERDSSLIVKVFDRKGEYQAFIADYGLYESEWEIIRGINKTEGHVRTYFETNYRTTRKVVEDLLIEEIIQRAFRIRGGQESEDSMSKTLLDMKDKLLELSRKKNEIGNYDRQMELLKAFEERLDVLREVYERMSGLRRDITSLYRLADSMERRSGERVQSAEKRLEELAQELKHLNEKIDTARYIEDRTRTRQMESRMLQLQKKTVADRTALEAGKADLALRESMNDFLEYQEEKSKRDETAVELSAMKSEKSTLLEQVQRLTFFMKKELARQQREMGAELSALDTKYNSLRIRIRTMDERERELSGRVAVSTARMEEQNRRKAELSARLAENKRKTGLLVMEESDRLKEAHARELTGIDERLAGQAEREETLRTDLEKVKAQLISCRVELKQLEGEQTLAADFMERYQNEKNKAEKLLEVYGARDYERLCEQIRERDMEVRAELKRQNTLAEQLLGSLERMQDENWGGFLAEPADAEQIREYISVRHGKKVQTGREYLAGLPEGQREELLREYPYLPVSFVTDGGIPELFEDAGLRAGKFGGAMFAVIKEAALRNRRELAKEEDIALFSRDFGGMLEEGAQEKEQGRLRAELSEAQYRIRRLKDQQETYREDEDFLRHFIFNYEEKIQEYRREKEEKDKRRNGLKEQETELAAQTEQMQTELAALTQSDRDLIARSAELKQEILVLVQIADDFAQYQELESALVKTGQEKQESERGREEARQLADGMEKEAEQVNARRGAIRQKLLQSERVWKEKYQKYDVPGEYGECTLTPEELEAELNGKRMAYEQEHAQEEDKNRLLQSYVTAMNRCLRSIGNRGISMSTLYEMDGRSEIFGTEESELAKLREELRKGEKALAVQQKELERVSGEWNRLHGKTGQLENELQERYGGTMELNLSEDEVEEYIENNRSRMERLAMEEQEQRALCRELAQESVLLADMRKDIERMAKSSRIVLEQGQQEEIDTQKAGVLKEQFRKLEEEYERRSSELKKRQDEFVKNRQKVIDTLVMLDGASLAEEMKESIVLPEDAQETARMIQSLNEVRECLALEKSRVESGIEDIISLKENFEDQCLQRCINIKTELDRLPKLSKITLDGEQIPMISLQIPYVREEFYRERMSAYIDEIVSNTDQFKDNTERMKYIRSALSFKKLFSIIVTDMNMIKLSLYKRERIREQSRLLRYEEAVGSTGQSQGIYIQFLIAIINYITNINSGKSDNTGLYKVIFIDNPFGAAKDIYIWEPIFELLRTNQVQLIVPARGTTPAITGRFDVNYILGQKLVGGRQQTVVVDYRSSIDTDETEYIPLQYEQEAFDLFSFT